MDSTYYQDKSMNILAILAPILIQNLLYIGKLSFEVPMLGRNQFTNRRFFREKRAEDGLDSTNSCIQMK